MRSAWSVAAALPRTSFFAIAARVASRSARKRSKRRTTTSGFGADSRSTRRYALAARACIAGLLVEGGQIRGLAPELRHRVLERAELLLEASAQLVGARVD